MANPTDGETGPIILGPHRELGYNRYGTGSWNRGVGTMPKQTSESFRGPMAKGFVIRGLLKDVKETFPPGIAALLEHLPPSLKPHFDRPVLHSLWYPYEVFTGLLEVMHHHIGKDTDEYLRELGRRTSERDISTFFKMVLTIVSPKTIGERSRTFWSQMFRPGEFRLEAIHDRGMTLSLHGFPYIHPLHCRVVQGYIEGLGKNWRKGFVAAHDRCIHRGGAVCSFRCRWEG